MNPSVKQLVEEHLRASEAETFKELSQRGQWTQQTGVFCLAPRQSGKTTVLKEFIETLKLIYNKKCNVIVICPYQAMTNMYKDSKADCCFTNLGYQRQTVSFMNPKLVEKEFHLVCDEFLLFDEKVLDTLLSKEWKSVTMIGSMK